MCRAPWIVLIALLLSACASAPRRADRARATPTATPAAARPAWADHSAGNEEISLFAMSLVDVPYRWGGNTPESGFDCSGLVRYVIERAAHINLPRTAREMSAQGKRITPDQVAPGDLIFFNTNGHPNSHVGIYVGHHRFVNAPSSGSLVRIDHVDAPYWARHFNGIRRIAVRYPFAQAISASPRKPANDMPMSARPAQNTAFDADDPIARFATYD
ncbi:C40 family peptidase [Candidatus Glomeribacter gigasporarum]|uniref:C40 family peptidase n=1 Tax=Candidatus Glomeribacter gigasporarum TaxID=132144 RepID=UPI0009DB3D1A